jgi:serine/threonine-protein kinase RsbW
MTDETAVTLAVPSEIRLLDLVHTASEKMAAIAGFPEEEALDLGLAVREAVVNAMTHDNRLDPKTPVELTLAIVPGRVRVRVADRGQGFDPAATADPTSTANRLRTSGRGILLIRAYVDEVDFRFHQGRGMEVTLTKQIRPVQGDVGHTNEGVAR